MSLYEYQARVIRVIDGDTVELDVDLGRCTHHWDAYRLLGIDAPDAKKGNAESKRRKREATEAARAILEQAGAPVLVRTYKPDSRDKHGRWLADIVVTPDGKTLSDLLLQAGHAVPYFGGKRE